MGVMSRRVLPACGNLCFFCPSLRARSRHPVKRYKKMLAEIFPRNQVFFLSHSPLFHWNFYIFYSFLLVNISQIVKSFFVSIYSYGEGF